MPPGEVAGGVEERALVAQIQAGRRFVEEQHLRGREGAPSGELAQHPGELHPGLLATREGRVGAGPEMRGVGARQGLGQDRGAVARPETPADPVEADPGHLRGGEGKGEVRGLRQHGA